MMRTVAFLYPGAHVEDPDGSRHRVTQVIRSGVRFEVTFEDGEVRVYRPSDTVNVT